MDIMSSQNYVSRADRLVGVWLLSVAGLIILMVLVGGLTRLTDSGLSITEWRPVTGALPPLSLADWMSEFDKYKAIPEYQLINKDFSLEEFKYIYWWEWGHRQLGRVIGLVFFIPFMFFLLRGFIAKQNILPLTGIFFLGGLQGFMGWYMVQSGLTDRVDVSQYRLAMHLGLALIIFCLVFWQALRLLQPAQFIARTSKQIYFGYFLIFMVFMQSLLGALVAGLNAGKTYTDWPYMNGDLIPSGLVDMQPTINNFFENHLTVQFDHRIGAYLLLILVILHFWLQFKHNAPTRLTAGILMLGVFGQAILGIITLMQAVPMHLGALHQLCAVFVLALTVYHVYKLRHTPHINQTV
jgi:cytochrome c oxidase assembly protein subunit 15